MAAVEAKGESLHLKGPEGERTVKVTDLASLDVRELSRSPALSMACYAWYVNRDLALLLDLTGGQTEGKGEIYDLLHLAISCARDDLKRGIEGLASSTADAASFPVLVGRWGAFPFFREQEDAIRLR